ncbi:hypothetical protein BS78_03G228100, partial [Paspalum vaginatum]
MREHANSRPTELRDDERFGSELRAEPTTRKKTQGSAPGKPGSLTSREEKPQFTFGRISAPLAIAPASRAGRRRVGQRTAERLPEDAAAAVPGRVVARGARRAEEERGEAGRTRHDSPGEEVAEEDSEAGAGEVGSGAREEAPRRVGRLRPVKYGAPAVDTGGRRRYSLGRAAGGGRPRTQQ